MMKIIISVKEYKNEDGEPFEISFSTDSSEYMTFIRDFLMRGFIVTLCLEGD